MNTKDEQKRFNKGRFSVRKEIESGRATCSKCGESYWLEKGHKCPRDKE